MSFFSLILQKNNLIKHDGRALWKYFLNDNDYAKLASELNYTEIKFIDPRDVTLFYTQWWKKKYDGGKPSKQHIFDALQGNIHYKVNCEEFYKLAIKGAQMLGVKWIKKQYTLYFRTLLLQGGLPLGHIAKNQGYYQSFLLAVLEEQPETIEDFIFKPEIVALLPKTSQNDLIYENCFEIVRSILNDESDYDELLTSDDVIKSISNELKIRKETLVKKQRLSKPKNYWLMNFDNEKTTIFLKIGLADSYDTESLENILGITINQREYQFFLNNDLICIFRKMANGKYKTDWYAQQSIEWDQESTLPYTYVIQNNEKVDVKDFIQTIPNFDTPTLWEKFSDTEWRLIKGSIAPNKEASLLFPNHWKSDLPHVTISVFESQMAWLGFEGEIEITDNSQTNKYQSGIDSFNWTIESCKPSWMLKANMTVVNNIPRIFAYDKNDKLVPRDKFKVWIRRHKSAEMWQELSKLNYISIGCIDLKIEKDGLTAYDMFFNIGNFSIKYQDSSIDHATLQLKNREAFEFTLDESSILEIESYNDIYKLQVNTQFSKIPTYISGNIGHRNHKKLYFELESPFKGMIVTDKDGNIVPETQTLSISNLYGIRILSSPNVETFIRIKNSLKTDVKITKEIKETSQPLIAFKDEIVRLYYLADAMNYKNKVTIELIEGRNMKTYEISGFSHTLNVESQHEKVVCLYSSTDALNLYAAPLNCDSKHIELIPLLNNDESYIIPVTEFTNEFIVISSKEKESQLMPRFISTDENFVGVDKNERIELYHSQLIEGTFDDEIWKKVLAYFNICTKHDLPFSTFDELRAISRSSEVAARAYLFLGINNENPDDFIQKFIPEMEQDLGFCFHWIKKIDWLDSIEELTSFYGEQYKDNIEQLLSSYMENIGLFDVCLFLKNINYENTKIDHREISHIRANLGERILGELPLHSPKITKDYGIPIEQHSQVKLLLRSPIAVAEAIKDIQNNFPLWAGNDFRDTIRRNIQYSQYLNPEFYNKTILHALKNN
jgi:hypothetical protein